MRIALFCHSLRSDWNHGNAHFLRGIVRHLVELGHEVHAFEPEDGWSATHLAAEQGPGALDDFHNYYPGMSVCVYAGTVDLDRVLQDVDLVLVHEWNDPRLVEQIGKWRARHPQARALFHDTHHRSVTRPEDLQGYDLRDYDGVLAFGERVREEYLRRGWATRVWTWHEAADVSLFHPIDAPKICDLVWIGNWGDGERTAEIDEFLLGPVEAVRATCHVFGVRYPPEARERLSAVGVRYRGWLPNYRVPEVFAEARVTVHIPRRPYVLALPGVPTIRPFEALACGIPLVSAPWDDTEGLFRAGTDYLVAGSGAEMTAHLRFLLNDRAAAAELAAHGLETILARHTCAHRVSELLAIARDIGVPMQGLPAAPQVLA